MINAPLYRIATGTLAAAAVVWSGLGLAIRAQQERSVDYPVKVVGAQEIRAGATNVIVGGSSGTSPSATLTHSWRVGEPRSPAIIWEGERVIVASGCAVGVIVPCRNTLRYAAADGSTVSVATTSGSITANDITNATLTSTSGDITATNPNGTLSATTTSGDIEASHVAGPVTLQTNSGDIRVQVRPGQSYTISAASTSGDVHIGVPQSPNGIRLEVRSASGNISVTQSP